MNWSPLLPAIRLWVNVDPLSPLVGDRLAFADVCILGGIGGPELMNIDSLESVDMGGVAKS